jgi:HTH-type transcriptional regulator/antitoxin HigA
MELMAYAVKTPEPQAITDAWEHLREVVGVTSVQNEQDYEQALAVVEILLDEIGENAHHPLADLLGYLADQVEAYEHKHYPIPAAPPAEVLRFLMDQHNLKQEDLADIAPQGRISDILSGKRTISKEIAKKLAQRFHVHADLFL